MAGGAPAPGGAATRRAAPRRGNKKRREGREKERKGKKRRKNKEKRRDGIGLVGDWEKGEEKGGKGRANSRGRCFQKGLEEGLRRDFRACMRALGDSCRRRERKKMTERERLIIEKEKREVESN